MNNTHKLSMGAMLALLFLLPIFFIPTLSVSLGVSKVILSVLAIGIAFIALLVNTFKTEELSLPKHFITLSALALVVVYFASSFSSSTPWLSLYGYIFETGTAVSILLFFAAMFISSVVFNNREKLGKVFSTLFLSLGVLALFALLKVFSGGSILVMSNFAGNMGNPVGAWTDYAMIFGLVATLSLFILGTLKLEGFAKYLVSGLFAISLFLLAVINFSIAWVIVLILGTILLIYFATVEKKRLVSGGEKGWGMLAATVLVAVSLIFVVNPTISSTTGSVSNYIAGLFGVSNASVRPALSATLNITKDAVVENPILGAGPNTFSKSWFLYKPAEINNTSFWNIAFPFGIGFLPTQFASTGILGIATWLVFFSFFLSLGVKALKRSPEERIDRTILLGSFLSALFLWIGAFVYVPSFTMMMLTFVFTGVFLAASAVTGIIEYKTLSLSKSALSHFISVLVIVALALGTLALAFISYQKVAAQIYYQRALVVANVEGGELDKVEELLAKAVNLSPNDTFWASLSESQLARANNALSATTGTTEENSALFQNSLSNSIAFIQNAIALNNTYGNWLALGNIYSSLVPAPLSVTGAYDAAKQAFESAKALNPQSPEIPLVLARLELSNRSASNARDLANEAIAKKTDYADAYFFLAQLDIDQGNLSQAIRSAETGVLLSPGNPGVLFQLGVLKYENRDNQGALEALNAALSLSPDYANAKFYLGLTLDRLNRKEEAIVQFENLAQTNPDNTLIPEVIKNLREGKAALSGLGDSGNNAPISGQ